MQKKDWDEFVRLLNLADKEPIETIIRELSKRNAEEILIAIAGEMEDFGADDDEPDDDLGDDESDDDDLGEDADFDLADDEE